MWGVRRNKKNNLEIWEVKNQLIPCLLKREVSNEAYEEKKKKSNVPSLVFPIPSRSEVSCWEKKKDTWEGYQIVRDSGRRRN